jgi:hypothetical protein
VIENRAFVLRIIGFPVIASKIEDDKEGRLEVMTERLQSRRLLDKIAGHEQPRALLTQLRINYNKHSRNYTYCAVRPTIA